MPGFDVQSVRQDQEGQAFQVSPASLEVSTESSGREQRVIPVSISRIHGSPTPMVLMKMLRNSSRIGESDARV